MSISALAGATDRVVAVGIDTASVDDSRRSLSTYGAAYVRRVCSPAEAAALPTDPEARARHLATLWAAKEAATKTLAPANDDSWPWPAVEIDLRDGSVTLHGRAAELAAAAGIGSVRVAQPFTGPLAGSEPAAAVPQEAPEMPGIVVVALALDGARPAATPPRPSLDRQGPS